MKPTPPPTDDPTNTPDVVGATDADESLDTLAFTEAEFEAADVEAQKVEREPDIKIDGIVAIVGRPNVGKSTLFNRLIEERKAIVDDQPGVTRDRNYGLGTWNGRMFSLIDTGGYIPESSDVFDAAIREQVEIALAEADVIIFVVDVMEGLTPFDQELLSIIRKGQHGNVLVAANKADNYKRELLAAEFYALGLQEVFAISAMSGSGTGELLDRMVDLLPGHPVAVFEPGIPKLAIVGRPNVGKSSFVNALLGRNNNIVTPIAGTTRDSIATRYNAFGLDFYLVDTAGLRRKARVKDNVEFYSTLRTLRAIEECDVALLMLDGQQGIEAQDLSILSTLQRLRKGIVILVNKWDLVEKTATIDREYRKRVDERIAPLSHIPILFVSATEKTRLIKALQMAQTVYADKRRTVPTHKLNKIMLPLIVQTPPASQRGRLVRIKFVSQAKDAPSPTFLFFCNEPRLVQENYKRFLENKIRENFGFDGWPINIYFKEK